MNRRLNLGSGPVIAEGWTSFDRDDYPGVTQGDWLRMPYLAASFDLVVVNHAFHMVDYTDIPAWFAEVRRVLAPGGWLRIIDRDLFKAIAAFERGDIDWFPIVDEAEQSTNGKLCAYLTWYSSARQVLTGRWMMELMGRHGFEQVTSVNYQETTGNLGLTQLDSRPTESFFVEGIRGR